ncbi:MAG: hypothetical protein ACI8ZM_003493 [Crocinitomix sp.]|jgi:hypothetical protein
MKNRTKSKTLILFMSISIGVSWSQENNSGLIQQHMLDLEHSEIVSEKHSIMLQDAPTTILPENVKDEVANGVVFKVDENLLNDLMNTRSSLISLALPLGGEEKELLLEEVNPLTADFEVYTSESPDEAYTFEEMPRFYRGIISGDENSLVSISIYKNELYGLIDSENGTYVLGRLKGTDNHIIYDDSDLLLPFEGNCETPDTELPYSREDLIPNPTRADDNCVRMYFEVDKAIYDNKGTVELTMAFVTGIFNQMATLYENDGMTLTVSEIFIWTTADPYPNDGSANFLLNEVRATRPDFDGDLCALLSFAGGGGLAWVDVLCSSYKYSYNGINSSYSEVPTYSWTVMVVSHETGHNLGSSHTHSCVWNGDGTQIDDCGNKYLDEDGDPTTNAGACYDDASEILPFAEGGTIMSYCHLYGGIGIDLVNGFGPQPTALMQGNIASAGCLTTCGGEDEEYCEATGLDTGSEWVKRVKAVGKMTNLSGDNGGYANFFDSHTISVEQGESIVLRLRPGFSGGKIKEYWRVWIDYDQDMEFDAGEVIYSGSGKNQKNITITIPADASLGETTMRVTMKRGSYSGPCESFDFGEVEDYKVNISADAAIPDAIDALEVDKEPAAEGIIEALDRGQKFAESNVTFYPNPAVEELNIVFEDALDESYKVVVYSSTGKEVFNSESAINNRVYTINTSELAQGIYVIKLISGEEILTSRITILH